jgi:Ca2+-transporting ATPase
VPVLPAQILWVNLIEGSLPSIALALDPAEGDVMKQKPAKRGSPILDQATKKLIALMGGVTTIVTFGIFLFFLSQNVAIEYVQTIVFSALAINTLFYSMSLRSLRQPLWRIKFLENPYLLGAIGVGFVLLVAAIYVPWLQILLRTVPIGFTEWIILIGFGILNIVVIELGKLLLLRRAERKRLI